MGTGKIGRGGKDRRLERSDSKSNLLLSNIANKIPLVASLLHHLRDPSLNSTMHASDSNVMTRDYYVSDGIQGMAYIVPNFNGKKFTGDMVELDLETAKYSTVRIHGIESDFADFYSKSAVEADGVDPYVKETSKSGTDQVIIKRLETLDPDLAGFHGGFSALYNDISYGFLVPYFNGVNHHGKVVRVYCGTYNSSKTDEWEEGTTFREFRTKMTSGEFEEFQQDIDFSSLGEPTAKAPHCQPTTNKLLLFASLLASLQMSLT